MAGKEAYTDFFNDKVDGNPLAGSSLTLSGNIVKDMDDNGIPDSKEGHFFISMAYVSSMVPGSPIIKGFSGYDEIVVTAKFPRNYVADKSNEGGIIRAEDHKNGEEPTYFPSKHQSDDYGDYNFAHAANCPDAELRSLLSIVVGSQKIWKSWFFDLLAASQVKPLKKGHVKAYAAWKGESNVDGSIIEYNFPKIKGGMMNIPSDGALRNLVSTGKWSTYRMTFASSTGLLARMVAECPKKYLSVFSEETLAIIRASNSNPWSEDSYRAIPERVLAIMYAYYLAMGDVPGDVWGPKRAYEALAQNEKDSLKNWFSEAKSKLVVYTSSNILISMPDSLKNV